MARSTRMSRHKESTNQKNRRRWLILLLFIIILAMATYYSRNHNQPMATNNTPSPSAVKLANATTSNQLSKTAITTMANGINNQIDQNTGIDISVNLIDLKSGQIEHYGVNQTFQAASTAKIITAEYFLHQVEAGKQSLGETINGASAKYELQQMIVVSDDTAWSALNNKLGYSNLQNYADSTFGISDYEAYDNSLSSQDIALALQKLWEGSILNAGDTQLLLSYMKQANYRQYIVPAVPLSDTIYHKIGLYDDYVNDAAIITHGNKAFAIVIFTDGNGNYNWTQRAITMQLITKAALKAYFNQ